MQTLAVNAFFSEEFSTCWIANKSKHSTATVSSKKIWSNSLAYSKDDTIFWRNITCRSFGLSYRLRKLKIKDTKICLRIFYDTCGIQTILLTKFSIWPKLWQLYKKSLSVLGSFWFALVIIFFLDKDSPWIVLCINMQRFIKDFDDNQ